MIAACWTIAGCGASHPKARTLEGPVTAVNQHAVCVGGPDASGDCFTLDALTRSLRVNDCVRVTYTPDNRAAPSTATTVDHLDPATHASQCPRQ
ncbi:MAG: hypothetical protein QM747_12940 [Nocardioides sp.]